MLMVNIQLLSLGFVRSIGGRLQTKSKINQTANLTNSLLIIVMYVISNLFQKKFAREMLVHKEIALCIKQLLL